ncbi:MAG: hypothetical protein K0R34_1461 [Herbinix sp.]|jgi:hypothetical protein|nr:hypothetical protein [Herbinix sp.]
MLLNAKKIAFMGLLLAITVLLIALSGILEFNTLFLLGAASFGVGIAVRESNIRYGTGFYLAAILLGLILAPNKFYCITFAVMGFYILVIEFTFDRLSNLKGNISRVKLYWLIKYITFNVLYVPMVLLLPKLIYQGEINPIITIVMLLAGQIVLFVYDTAYRYFQSYVWGKIRTKLTL